jgi:hypothetical protein
MYPNQTRYLLLILLLTSLITACSPPSLGQKNCQLDDIDNNPPFLLIDEDTAVPPTAPFTDQITGYHRAALAEYQVTYTDALCTIRIYPDHDLAAFALTQLCQQSIGVQSTADFGDQACRFQDSGVVELHFRQDTAVITIREDLDGTHVPTWAAAVSDRLND